MVVEPWWWLVGIGGAVLVLVVAGVAWSRWVRSEVGSAGESAFLLLERLRGEGLPIAGAEPDPQAQPPMAPRAFGGARAGGSGWGRPTREMPVVTVSGGVHALLVGGSAALAATAQPAVDLPSDATLQFLPGRLVLAAGAGVVGREVRFVRQPGPVTEVTLGRQAGPQERHVQLAAPTVSRLHARMRYEGGRWAIADLSETNPVRVNGKPLASGSGVHVLVDGDRVGVGELELVFRER